MRPRPVDEGIELVLAMPPGDGAAVRRDPVGVETVTDAQGVLQHALDARRKSVLVMIAHEGATAAQQMSETGLMHSAIEAPVRGPAIANEDPRKISAEHRGGVLKAAAWLNG